MTHQLGSPEPLTLTCALHTLLRRPLCKIPDQVIVGGREDQRDGSRSARSAFSSFLERLERDAQAREESKRQLEQRVRRERGGGDPSEQQRHLADLRFLRYQRHLQQSSVPWHAVLQSAHPLSQSSNT